MKAHRIALAGLTVLVLGAAWTTPAIANPAAGNSKPLTALPAGWTTYHHDNSRNGYDASAPAFSGGPFSNWNNAVDQSIYAEPLAVGGRVYVATMGDSIYAFDVATGTLAWSRLALGTPETATHCSFSPGHLGIMSTPVIDPSSGIIYAVGFNTAGSKRYQMYALNVADGTTVTGFPVDLTVDPTFQNQRAALALGNGHVYAAFGGYAGDCGTYHPQVVSVPVTGVTQDHIYNPQTGCMNGASIWGPSGIAIDGSGTLYVVTGNGTGCFGPGSFPCDGTQWDYSNAILKLSATLVPAAFWAPDNATQSWCALAATDLDIGSLGPTLLPGNTIFQTGKSGYDWLVNSTTPGSFNGQLFQGHACNGAVFGGVAYYAGRVYIPCDGVGLVALSVDTTTHTIGSTADWIQNVTPGPPIAAMGLIWTRNQAGTTLYGFDPATGAQRVATALGGGSNHFGTLAEDGGWIFVPHGANIRAFNFNAPPCASTTSASWFAACTYKQKSLAGNNGSTWVDMDATNLSVTFTPAANSFAVISGNADLWTSSAGFNQDLGLAVTGGVYPTTTGQPEAWKESGGGAAFSPNAAMVQRVIPVLAATAYTARLQWKASRSDPGTIYAGAGPIASNYSPTRISVMLVPTSAATVFQATSTAQYNLTASDGATWQNVDATILSVPFTPPAGTWLAFISGNADLWTANAGYNQDLGIAMTGTGFPTTANQPEAWRESGGLAGTFSPNAAFAQTEVAVTAGTAYTARLQWKASRSDPGTIYAGAGPVPAGSTKYSPTSLSVVLIPSPAGAVVRNSTAQFSSANSNGSTWQAINNTSLQLTLAPGATSNYLLSANADLWTNMAGFNQDIGIMVSGGTFGTGTLVAWKESGGAGAYSPNAAFAYADVPLVSATTYTVWLVWKTNGPAPGVTIFAGAGPSPTGFSPTSLTAVLLN